MLALSTSWKSAKTVEARALLQSLESLPISSIELDYRISEPTLEDLKKLLAKSRLKVVSVHNYLPKPVMPPGARASGDFYLLSSLDKDERRRAVRRTQKTIENADELGARAVVLHGGRVEMERELSELYHYFESDLIFSKTAQAFIQKKLKQRDKIKGEYLESLLTSLNELCRTAEKHNVLLGLENRFHYDELPTLNDFEHIFTELDGAPLGYWHDTGHAHVNEQLTIVPAGSLLRKYADKLIGVHLHDAIDLEDHLSPGCGEIDFRGLKSYLRPDMMKVIELKSPVKKSGVIQGIHFIRKILPRTCL